MLRPRRKIDQLWGGAFLALATLAPACAQKLSPPEEKMVAAIEKNNPESVAFLEEIVDVNSGTMNTEGVHKVADMLAPRFRALGFQVRWVPMDEVHRAGHLIAEHPAPSGKRMLLIGHLDTVFEKDSPFQTFVRDGNKATGPGSTDIKGGDMVMIAALEAMQAAGVLKDASISVILTGDEERFGEPVSISRRDLVNLARQSDVALDFEGGSSRNGVDYGSTSRRSSIIWDLKATGATGHSSGIFHPSIGYGAIYEIARIIDAFRQELPEKDLTFNVGYVVGGSSAVVDSTQTAGTFTGKANVIPPVAFASGDIRTVSDEQTRRVEDGMQKIVAQHLPKTDARLDFQEGYPAMEATPGNRALLGILNQVNRDAGLQQMQELDPSQRGAGDISFIAKYVDCLAGMGAIGGNGHREGEFIELDHLPVQGKRAALLMYRLSEMPRSAPLAP
ncbi:MAG TPA: M20/M25/M40 family metallo-hydrolase [Acidobacteriaceae bacterium]|nr:M20/M25/M40 family metallo-hydrolase [Acidobacteriaceae bacterium]